MQHAQCQFPRVLLANALGNVLPLQTQDSAVTRANRRATEKSASSRTTLRRSRAIVASRRRSQPRPTSLLDGHSLLTIGRKRHLSCHVRQAPPLFGRPAFPACVVARWARYRSRRFTILLLRSRSIPELGARNNRTTF